MSTVTMTTMNHTSFFTNAYDGTQSSYPNMTTITPTGVQKSNTFSGTVPVNLSITEILTVVLLAFLCFIGTFGNALVIWVFRWKKRRTKKRFELLLTILAFTDLLSSMIVPLLFLYGTVTQFKQWHFGYYGCKIIMSLFPVTVTISQGILILISFERYKSIHNPFGGALRKTFIFCWLVVTCVVALVLVSPYVYSLELVSNETYGVYTCAPASEKFEEIFLYSTGNFCRDFVATFCMIVLGSMTNKSLKSGGLLGGIRAYQKRQENSNKARKMLIVVVCVFCFCVIPMDLYQVIIYSLYKLKVNISKTSYENIRNGNTFLTILQIANSATNMIIYSRMHRDFTRQIFACARKSKKLASDSFSRATLRSTFRSTRSASTDSFSKHCALLAILPITPDTESVFISSCDSSQETKFSFSENKHLIIK